jgi:GT2 family glycosyltransferase/glycosyltransferase involved in cell wall biosynthesis
MTRLLRAAHQLLLFLLSPFILFLTAVALGLVDFLFLIFGRKDLPVDEPARNHAASVVIPNWNGRDLLETYLPSVVLAMSSHPDNEVIVVDNASEDGSAAYLAEHFPRVRVIALPENRGFGGGSNTGFQAAKNDIVVLLNSDMRIEANFLQHLLRHFRDPRVFSVSCQIFFSDAAKRREETGLTQAWWEDGRLKVRHRIDEAVTSVYPCFYPGGGSSAFDRRKFLELGGFDHLFKPFYYEDTDLGFMAWKRGWKVLYEPASIVFHEHRGTIGRKFTQEFIQGTLKKNAVLLGWKNVHNWRMLSSQLTACFSSSTGTMLFGDDSVRYSFGGLARAFLQLPEVLAARWHARAKAAVSDVEALRRPLGGYYRDRFQIPFETVPEKLSVLFVAPYPIEPPIHGGAVFMKQTLEELAPLAEVHLAGFVEAASQVDAQAALAPLCASMNLLVRQPLRRKNPASLLPHAVREFADADLDWILHRILYLDRVDVVQLEYTMLGQYAGRYLHIPCMLFEHDVFFQSLARGIRREARAGTRFEYFIEYLRALHYETRVLSHMSRVQVCSEENASYLKRFAPTLAPIIDSDLRAGIRTAHYQFALERRIPNTMLFVGSFRHLPNREALTWFVDGVLPRVVAQAPDATLVIVGSDLPPSLASLSANPNIRLTGFVDDIRKPLRDCAVFVCPILSGSGIRVKLLEAFAAGIPAVSTTVGAEGLTKQPGLVCELSDTPAEFAAAVLKLFSDRDYARQLANRARQEVASTRDIRKMTAKLERVYRSEVVRLRKAGGALSSGSASPLVVEEHVSGP